MHLFDRFKQAVFKSGWRGRKSRWSVVLALPYTGSAFVWRSLLLRTRFIAITGSFGKTAAKDCLAAILSQTNGTAKTLGSKNGRRGIARTLLAVRPWHEIAVVETGTDRRGGLARASLLVRPHLVVELSVDRTHTDALRTLDETATEKAQLLRFMSRNGTAVLNGDDERVAGMAGMAPGRVLTFGTSPDHDLWATGISAQWPDRLSFTAHTKDETAEVRTRFVGKHWVPSVLGAMAAARACGVPLADAAVGVAQVESFDARMKPHTLPGGAVVLRDDYNGSIASFEKAVEVLREARVTRRVLVVGDCSDFRKKPRERMNYYAKTARVAADIVVFIGERCEYGVRRAIREGFEESSALGFFDLAEAAEWLRGILTEGDLVLLRGTHSQHLARLYFRLIGSVECQRTSCRMSSLCDTCPQLGFEPRRQADIPTGDG
jgi:UDP-N-acetylmuramoyl-tripeptide--D-alanyl-D-alanine ligase